jgi:hypothetical protein
MSTSSGLGSFRDPSGHVYMRDGVLYRQVNHCYQEHYKALMDSGLYETLTSRKMLVPHEEVDLAHAESTDAYKVLRPERIPFISYPYEWCFSELKDAALLTLQIQKQALDVGMWLKDASAYNVQFLKGHPVFVDTLSLSLYQEGHPWVAYRQFCQHFVAPLALMRYCDVSLSQLYRVFIDGVPLHLASRILGIKTYTSISLLMHIGLHARTQKRFEGASSKAVEEARLSRRSMLGLIDGLETWIKKLEWKPGGTEWADYYSDTNYSDEGFQHKRQLVREFVTLAHPKTVWDLGANTGTFSRIAQETGAHVVAFDVDPSAVEKNYRNTKAADETSLLPLVLDLSNPSNRTGWAESERMSLSDRGPADMAMALALIHHLAITYGVPLAGVAAYLKDLCLNLIIEFVPKSDSQVQRLLDTREDVFCDYHKDAFEKAFEQWFEIKRATPVEGTERTLYLMERR